MVTYFGRRKPSPAGLSQANTNTTNHHLRKQSSNVFTGGSEHRKNCESTNFEASQVWVWNVENFVIFVEYARFRLSSVSFKVQQQF